jgi:type I restriction enzyme S subunit
MSCSGWNHVSLKEICEIIGGGTPKTSVEEYWNGDIPWLSVIDFNNESRHVFCTEKTITEKGLINSSTKILNPSDIIISARGTVGALAQLAVPMAFNQSCYGIRARNMALNDFLYYGIKNIITQIKANTHGSVFDTITRSTFDNLKIMLPSIEEQKAIAATLSCLDDKIELNNRINKTLEEMAQAIFKSWFVDFEPFQDGEFEDSELGRIPKGWRVGYIGELIESTLCGDWGKESEQGNYTEEVACIRGADIPEIAIGKRGKPPVRFILKKNLEKKQLSKDQIVIEISGGSPTQSTGRTALITNELIQAYKNPLICTNFCRVLSLKKKEYSTFVYSLMQYLYRKSIFFLYENGTTGIKNLDTGMSILAASGQQSCDIRPEFLSHSAMVLATHGQ